ncbi:MAG: hypothetical protein IKD70_08400 [Eggerthellaceae bacterium]|nr:hypothetical protein [Eggerthellaceae bacterium]
MLTNLKAFQEVEQMLVENGTIAAFEAENGPITGRMLIELGQVPSTLADQVDLSGDVVVFRGSFDFYNSTVGVAMDVKTKKAKSGVWEEEQKLGAYQVPEEWVRYFLAVLLEGIGDDGSYGVPIFCFVNEDASFEVYPAGPEE